MREGYWEVSGVEGPGKMLESEVGKHSKFG